MWGKGLAGVKEKTWWKDTEHRHPAECQCKEKQKNETKTIYALVPP